jgi:hypothetical protein
VELSGHVGDTHPRPGVVLRGIQQAGQTPAQVANLARICCHFAPLPFGPCFTSPMTGGKSSTRSNFMSINLCTAISRNAIRTSGLTCSNAFQIAPLIFTVIGRMSAEGVDGLPRRRFGVDGCFGMTASICQ